MPRPGHVYVMDCGEGVLKVGFSNSPDRRSEDLGGLPIIHRTDWSDRAELIEKSAHKLLKLAGHHIENELFRIALSDAVEAIEQAADLVASGNTIKGPSNFRKVRVSFRLDADLLKEVGAWIDDQPVRPSMTAVIEAALRRHFLEERQEIFAEMAEEDDIE